MKFTKTVSLVIAIILILGAFAACNSSKGKKASALFTPKAAMYEYVEAVNAKDAKRLVNLNIPEDLANRDDVDLWSVEEEAKWTFSRIEEKCGKNYKLEIKILEEEYLKSEELQEEQEFYKETLDMDIENICNLTVEMTAKGEKETISETDQMTFVKYKGKWYLMDL